MAENISKRSIVYEILTDTKQAQADSKQAVDTFKKFGDELEKNATKAKRLSTQLRDMRNQLAQLDEGSAEFQHMAVVAAKLEDKLGDVNQRVRNLASDTKNLDAFVSIAQGIAGGFAVAQGAVALFGKENKDLEKALLKVQGSLAILNGLQQVQATILKESAAKTFIVTNAQKIYTFVTTGATAATRLFNAALVGIGAGAVIAGIVYLISKMNILGDSAKDAAKNTRDLNDELDRAGKLTIQNLNNSINKVKTSAGLAALATSEITDEISRLNGELDKIPREGQILIINGQTVKQNFDEARRKINDEIARLKNELDRRDKKIEIPVKIKIIEPTKSPDELLQDALDKQAKEREKFAVKTVKDIETVSSKLLEQTPLWLQNAEAAQLYLATAASVFGQLAGIAKEGSTTQIILAEIGILANSAQAIAAAISGGAKSGDAMGPAAIVSTPAFIATLVGTVVSAFTQTYALLAKAKAAQGQLGGGNNKQRNAVAFAEGTPYLERDGHPKGTDTIPIMANEGERIIPTDDNLRHWDIFEAIRQNQLEDYINFNYVSPALATKAIEESSRDSMIDYSTRFYRQWLISAEGNSINKKAVGILNSIDRKIGNVVPPKYSR